MAWDQIGYNKYLVNPQNLPSSIQQIDSSNFEFFVWEIPSSQIIDHSAHKLNYTPTHPPKNPKEGDLYYDQMDKKLKVHTGTVFETITSS